MAPPDAYDNTVAESQKLVISKPLQNKGF